MAITNQDLTTLRRWGRCAALDPEGRTHVLAGQYLALALNDHERSLIRSEFEEGVRNSGVGQNRINDVMWEFKDWFDYWGLERETDANS